MVSSLPSTSLELECWEWHSRKTPIQSLVYRAAIQDYDR